MTETFKQQIKTFQYPLFYNTSGDPRAFKLNVRHLSASSFCGLAQLIDGYIFPKSNIYILNLELETISLIEEKIELVELEVLK
jgi:hypothetical protein